MRKILIIITCILPMLYSCGKKGVSKPEDQTKPPVVVTGEPSIIADCKKCIIMAEQTGNGRVIIVNTDQKKIIWEWNPVNADVKPEDVFWFGNPSDAKIVYNGKYILMSASKGGIALIRIADKKTVYYANAVGSSNPHSAELLPDGNIVSASSTGNYLALFKVDTLNSPGTIYKKITLTDAHNVVWDYKNALLWVATGNQLKTFAYNKNCADPGLTETQSYSLPSSGAHELFPVYKENALWLTNSAHVYKFDVATRTLAEANTTFQATIKSVSSGPSDFPTIILRPKEEWWTDEVLDFKGNSIFIQSGLKIYKARWVLHNYFSYPADDLIKQCAGQSH